MTIIDRVRRILGLRKQGRSTKVESPELLALLRGLQVDESAGLDELVEELLYEAIAGRQAAEENFEPWVELTPRERQTAALACLGLTNRQIAEHMVISNNTVKTHLRHVLHKFDVNSKSQLREVLNGWDFQGWLQGQGLLPGGVYGASAAD